jgi:serine/threonine protein kinase
MSNGSLRATQGWARMATRASDLDMNAATLAEPGRLPAPGGPASITASQRPRSISVLPTVHAAPGGVIELLHEPAERYRPLGILGAGGMGIVERAEDVDIGRPVAIKRLLPEASHALGVARFVSEIRIVGSLDHPHVVPIHDVGVDDDGRYFFVMKYVEGHTLADIIDRLAAGDTATLQFWTFERRVELIIAVLQALAYAHERGIIHRDIKPENIMVGAHGEVRLMDWGIARRIGELEPGEAPNSAGEAAPGLIGTPAYMSPEQAACRELDARSDLYSLAVTFHEFLALRHYLAHRADSLYDLIDAVQNEPIDVVHGDPGGHALVPPELRYICARGLMKDPAQRFQSATEIIDELRAYIDGRSAVRCSFTLTKRMLREGGRMVDRRPRLAVGLAVAHSTLAAFGFGALVWMLVT